jgi:signal transduction histidine kinase
VNGLRRAREALARRVAATSVGTLLGATIGVLLTLAIVGIGVALIANGQVSRNRRLLLSEVAPAQRTALALENALVNEESGVRGLALTSEPSFLEPYDSGLIAEREAYRALEAHAATVGRPLASEVASVRARADEWRAGYVAPTLIRPNPPKSQAVAKDLEGKQLFDGVRRSLASLHDVLVAKDRHARARLSRAADTLQALLIAAGVLILGGVLAAGFVLRRTVTRPLRRLGAEARRVAGGEFAQPLTPARGPREVAETAVEIDAMRRRIVDELAAVQAAHRRVEAQALELTRSNAELEQFAYVASHDLQEPLRKVASFGQALQAHYGDRLDTRGRQYLEFAVDGARRMQELINDLLAFSRVGRGGREPEPVALGDVVAAARSALAQQLAISDGRVETGDLPTLVGDRAQLISLFQNLISNALKFRGADPPVVRIGAIRRDGMWELSCTDNGIGIDGENAERVFMVFQRLHSRDEFEGTGIGLALARKIVEYHGGQIWLDHDHAGGASFRFTFPAIELP